MVKHASLSLFLHPGWQEPHKERISKQTIICRMVTYCGKLVICILYQVGFLDMFSQVNTFSSPPSKMIQDFFNGILWEVFFSMVLFIVVLFHRAFTLHNFVF